MIINRFDLWLENDGPVAVALREYLEPALGADSVVFPPTFAPPEGSKEAPGYVIDNDIALIDTVGSQANRMEPIFKRAPYSALVPRVRIRIGEREIDLLDAGHRAADAAVRFSDKWNDLRAAFNSIRQSGDATLMAKRAPTTLLFGAWDSRDTQVKIPRLIGATIRAFGAQKLTRSAQFFSALDKEEVEDLGTQDFLSQVGLNDAPAGRTHGGVIAKQIRRDAILNLVALRALGAPDEGATLRLRRYILGLALVALLTPAENCLREGCLLTRARDKGVEGEVVGRDGSRVSLDVDEATAREFALAAAGEFGVGESWTAVFSKESVKAAANEKAEKGKGKKR